MKSPKARPTTTRAAEYCMLESLYGEKTVTFEPGDFIKFEIKDESTGQAEWVWLRVDCCDDSSRFVFGWLDSQPVAVNGAPKLGQRLAVSYDNIREHKKASEFTVQ